MSSIDIYNIKSRLIDYRIQNSRSWTSIIKDPKLKSDLESIELYNDLPLNQKASALLLGYIPSCECGKPVKFCGKIKDGINGTPFGGWLEFCSSKCARSSNKTVQRRKQTTIERFGADSWAKSDVAKLVSTMPWTDEKKSAFNENSRKTCILKYGVDHYSKTEEFKQKVIETTLSQTDGKYTNHFQDVDKIKKTNQEKYGVDYYTQTVDGKKNLSTNNAMRRLDIKLKSKLNRMSNQQYSEEFLNVLLSQNPDIISNYIHNIAYANKLSFRQDIAKELRISYTYLNRIMRLNGMDNDYLSLGSNKSHFEQSIYDYISSLNVIALRSDRTVLEGKEIDILIESNKLGIECDGIYFHSVFTGGKDKEYHLSKTLLAESKGYKLLHIFENEWKDPVKQCIWKSIIKSKLGLIENKIYARKCSIKPLTSKEARLFFDNNHLSGFVGAEHHVGLFFNGELVSAISYGKSRFDKSETELYRFASLLNTQVVGGMSKLINTIPEKDKLISYADRRLSGIDSSYQHFFKYKKELNPTWWGFKSGTLNINHRLSYTKQKVIELLDEKYDYSLSIFDNMFNNGYDIIYDCGNYKFYN